MNKLFLTASLLIVTAPALASVIHCASTGGNNARVLVNSESGQTTSAIYGFSAANFLCPDLLEDRIKNEEDFTCSGLWNFDFDEARNAVDTPAILHMHFVKASQEWIADFVTGKSYGSKQISLECDR